jgi:tetratricopeptide (TPR) repeat protein
MTTYPKLLCVSLLFGLGCALAQSNAQPKAQPESKTQTPEQPRASALTGEWLYEILLGELQVLQGDTGAGFSLLLDAARQSGDERLYERAVDVALRVRSGDGALLAASAWRQAAPQSEKANRKLLQIQVALQKLKDARYSLTQAVVLAAPEDKASIILSMPKLLERVSQQAQASQILQEALTTWLSDTELGPVAWTAIGQMQLAARDPAAALQSAQRGFELNQKRIEPLWLGLELARSHRPPGLEFGLGTGAG